MAALHQRQDSAPPQQLQEYYLLYYHTQLTINSWMRGFIGKLLELTHLQWIFHNIIKHYYTNMTIKLDVKKDTMREIERQLIM